MEPVLIHHRADRRQLGDLMPQRLGVIAGQGTLALELMADAPAKLDALLVCTGGGGMVAGCALAVEGTSPGTQVWAVEPEGSDDTLRSLQSGTRQGNPPGGSALCDALLSPMPGAMTFAVNQPRLAGGLVVSDAEVLAAIASVHPAIEVLHSRFGPEPDAWSGLADSGGHAGLVLGPAVAGWTALDLAAETLEVRVDGIVVKRGQGNPGGPILRLLQWLADTGARWDGGLRAGQVVTTGSWTGKDLVRHGQTAAVTFAHCGVVRLG